MPDRRPTAFRYKRVRSGATINRIIAAGSHAFSVAERDWGWIDANPFRKLRKEKESAGRARFLSEEEQDKLLAACKESRNPFLYLITVLALATGMRKNEVLSLCWKDVDLGRGWIILERTKNQERRGVGLGEFPLNLLKEHRKVRRLGSDLVFPSRTDPSKPADIRSAWQTAVGKAGIEDFRFHDLRHSAASLLVKAGISLPVIGAILGHKTPSMTQRYSHIADKHLAEVVKDMNAEVFGKG